MVMHPCLKFFIFQACFVCFAVSQVLPAVDEPCDTRACNSPGQVRLVSTIRGLEPELRNAGTDLVVVQFSSTWCIACDRMMAYFLDYCAKYLTVQCLAVDEGRNEATTIAEGVEDTPAYGFYRNKKRIELFYNPTPETLEAKIKQHLAGDDGTR